MKEKDYDEKVKKFNNATAFTHASAHLTKISDSC